MLWRGLHFDWANYVTFTACFMLRGRDTHTDFLRLLFLVGMTDNLPSDARAFSLTSFETYSSSLRLNKGFRLFNFLQSPSLIWMTESDFLLSVNVMVSYNEFCHAGPSSLVFLQDVKFSRMVIHRSKFRRMDCSLNWSYFKHGELRCESGKIAL